MIKFFRNRRNARNTESAKQILVSFRTRATEPMFCDETLLQETGCQTIEQLLSEVERCQPLVESGDMPTINMLVQKYA